MMSDTTAQCLGATMCVLGFMGVFGNATSIIILSHRAMRSPVTLLLLGLSCTDLVLVVLCVLSYSVPLLQIFSESNLRIYVIYSAVSTHPVAHTFQTISLWLLVLITIERFIAVSQPFRVTRVMSNRRAIIYTLGISLISLLYNLCRFFEWELVYVPQKHSTNNLNAAIGSKNVSTENSSNLKSVFHSGNQSTISSYSNINKNTLLTTVSPQPIEYDLEIKEHLRGSTIYFYAYFTAGNLVINFTVPLLVLIALNGRIAMIVRRSQTQRRTLTSCQQSEHRIATMMVVIVGMFLVCRTTAPVLNIVESIQKDLFTSPATSMYAYLVMDMSNTLIILSLSSNWIIYLIFNRRYRLIFIEIYCRYLPCLRPKKATSMSNYYYSSTLIAITGNTNRHRGSATPSAVGFGRLRSEPSAPFGSAIDLREQMTRYGSQRDAIGRRSANVLYPPSQLEGYGSETKQDAKPDEGTTPGKGILKNGSNNLEVTNKTHHLLIPNTHNFENVAPRQQFTGISNSHSFHNNTDPCLNSLTGPIPEDPDQSGTSPDSSSETRLCPEPTKVDGRKITLDRPGRVSFS